MRPPSQGQGSGCRKHPVIFPVGSCHYRDSGCSCPAQYVSLPMPQVQIHSSKELGLPAKDNLLHFQKNTAEKSVSLQHAQTLFQYTASPGHKEKGLGETGKSLPEAEGFSGEPSDPFPHLLSSPGTGSLTDGVAWEGAWCNSHAGNEPRAWLFPGTACTALARTRETAVIAERLWGRGLRAALLKSTAWGMGGTSPHQSPRGAPVSWALGHSHVVIHWWELPVPSQWRKPHLSSSWVLQGYGRGS